MTVAARGERPPKPPWYRDPDVRALLAQALFGGAVLLVGYLLVSQTLANLERQGISSGFGFLSSEAGFGITTSLIEYSEESSNFRVFLVGLLNTLLVSACGIVVATILGFVIGVARLSSNWIIAKLASIYVEIFRNLPLLLQIFFWYFAVLRSLPSARESLSVGETIFLNNRGLTMPDPNLAHGGWAILAALAIGLAGAWLWARRAERARIATGVPRPVLLPALGLIFGLPLATFFALGAPLSFDYPELGRFRLQGGLTIIPEFMALLFALSIYTAAFIAEIVRAGILAVHKGQTEASFALGLRPGTTLRLVVIPQAMRVIIPPLTSQYLNLTKNSSLAAAIAYPELVSQFAGTVLNQTGQAVEVLAMTMAVYLTISLSIAALMNWYNARKALVER